MRNLPTFSDVLIFRILLSSTILSSTILSSTKNLYNSRDFKFRVQNPLVVTGKLPEYFPMAPWFKAECFTVLKSKSIF